MNTAVIGAVRFTTAEELFETDDGGYADLEISVEWVPPDADIAGTHLSAPQGLGLWIDLDARAVTLPILEEGTALRSWQLRQVTPVVAACFNRLTLHASAVATDDGVTAFIGETGVGKSTLAWHLVKAGASPVSDDLLPVRFDGDPAIPDVNGSHPIRAVCFLSRGSAPSLAPIEGPSALKHHITNGFGEHGDPSVWAFQFDAYHRLADAVPAFELVVPDDRIRLDEITAWLIGQL